MWESDYASDLFSTGHKVYLLSFFFFIGFLVHSIWLISRIYSNGWHSKDFLPSLWCPNKNVEFFRMLVCRRTVVQDTGYTHDKHYNLNCMELSCHISSVLWIWLDSLPLNLLIVSDKLIWVWSFICMYIVYIRYTNIEEIENQYHIILKIVHFFCTTFTYFLYIWHI